MIERFTECLTSLETSLDEQKDFYSRYLNLQECRENLYRNLFVFTTGFMSLALFFNLAYFFLMGIGWISPDGLKSLLAYNQILAMFAVVLTGGFSFLASVVYKDAFLHFIQSPFLNSQKVDYRTILRLQELEVKNEITSLISIDNNWSLTKKWWLVFTFLVMSSNLMMPELRWFNIVSIPLLYCWITPLLSKAYQKNRVRNRDFWKEKDSIGLSNAAKLIIKGETLQPRFFEKNLELEEEFFKAVEDLLKQGSDQLKTFFVNYILMNPTWLNSFYRVVNEKTEFLFNKESLAWMVLRVLKGDLRLVEFNPLIKKKIAYLEFMLGPGKRHTTWELAVFSQNVEFVKMIYVPNIEFETIQGYGDLSACLFTPELRDWAKEHTLLFRNEAFNLIGGWTKDYILIGSSSLPFKDLEKIRSWEDLGLKNKRLQEVFFRKLFLSLEDVTLRDEFKELISLRSPEELKSLKFVSGSLLHFVLMIRDLNFDLNVVANFIEKFNWGSIPYNYNIWRPVNFTVAYPDTAPGEKSSLVRQVLWQLLKHYSPEKSLKIIFASLALDEFLWLDTLAPWLKMKSNPDLFLPPIPPRKVKNLSVLHRYFSWAAVHAQNPNLELKQEAIKELSGIPFRDYMIIVPQYNREFIEQGQALQICLGNTVYYDKVIRKESYIFFLKQKDKVAYVVEITPRGEIRQARSFANSHLGLESCEALSSLCAHVLLEKEARENN